MATMKMPCAVGSGGGEVYYSSETFDASGKWSGTLPFEPDGVFTFCGTTTATWDISAGVKDSNNNQLAQVSVMKYSNNQYTYYSPYGITISGKNISIDTASAGCYSQPFDLWAVKRV